MNTDRRDILGPDCNGPHYAERGRTTAASANSLVMVCLAQLNRAFACAHGYALLQRAGPGAGRTARKALSPITGPITDPTPLMRVEGLL